MALGSWFLLFSCFLVVVVVSSSPLTPLQEKFQAARNAGISTQHHQEAFHSSSCLGTQYVQIPRKCPQRKPKILSFPKSGRTWMRCIVSSMNFATQNKNLSEISLGDLDSYAPTDIKFSHDKPHPYRLTKDSFSSWKHLHKDDPLILLARDPRDVAVSNYHEVVHRAGWENFGPYSEVVRNMSLSELLRFDYGSFQTNVAMINFWATRGKEEANCPRMVLYYENMQSEECWENEYHKFATFLGYWLSKSQLFQVRERCSFNHLKNDLMTGDRVGSYWRSKKKGDEDSAKVRKGKVGGYLEEMSRKDIEWMEERALFVGEFMEYDSRYRGTVKMNEKEMQKAVDWWTTT